MKKRIISILLAAVLMLGVLPMTATAAETDGELAETGAIYHYVTTAAELKSALEIVDRYNIHKIVVKEDIIETIGTPGDYSDRNYIPVWCTVGTGNKILELQSYTVELKSDYCAIYDGYGSGPAYHEAKSVECLFSIPDGARLTVNGGYTSSTYAGTICYKGVLLNKCDAIDQRDIFHLDGGWLTINSGNFAPGWTRKKYTWDGGAFASGSYEYLQVNGTPVTVNDGELTINGGYFEGIGLNTYGFKLPANFDTYDDARNAALKLNGSTAKVTINNGHFYGRSKASCISGKNYSNMKLTIRSGRFEIDQSAVTTGVEYGNLAYVTSSVGKVGIPLTEYDSNIVYYSTSPTTVYNDSGVKPSAIKDLRTENFYMVPQSKSNDSSLPQNDNTVVTFKGYEYDLDDPDTWSVAYDQYLEVNANSLYYPNLYSVLNSDLVQDLYGYVNLYRMDDKGGKSLIYEHRGFAAHRADGDPYGNWAINITGIFSEKDRTALVDGQRYMLEFDIYEQLKSQPTLREATHKAYYCANIDKSGHKVRSVNLTITEPYAGATPDFTVTKDNPNCDFYSGFGLVVVNGTGLEFIDHSKGEPEVALLDWQYYMKADEVFKAGTKYTARIFLWTGDSAFTTFHKRFTAKINGKDATVSDVSSGKETLCYVDYTFTVEGASGGYWIGDVNDDGAVKNRDALILDRYIAGWKDYDKQIKNWDAADLNRDSQIKNRDALMLDRYIAGWKEYQKYVKQV